MNKEQEAYMNYRKESKFNGKCLMRKKKKDCERFDNLATRIQVALFFPFFKMIINQGMSNILLNYTIINSS